VGQVGVELTSYTLDNLDSVEVVYVGGVCPIEELEDLDDYEPSMIQVSTPENLWFIHALPRNEHTGTIAGALPDAVNVGRHASGPFKIEGVTVDVNEDPIPVCEVYLLRSDLKGMTVIQRMLSGGDGAYLFYVDDPTDTYLILAFKDSVSIKGVTARDLVPVAS
jgi:hypothetical protein